ncbi:MAG: ATP-dependent Clp protease adaptor ClpS [Ignavibacteria bacterium]|nr:ATP-dependent Clp protease adaptor ClpS [Ignavibacteria bacterium]
MPLPTPDVQLEVTDGVDTTHPAKVILFNDEVHTFDDVATQLVKAIGCSLQRGYDFANEVHTRGKARVFTGDMPDCLRVSGVLEEIALHTQIEM